MKSIRLLDRRAGYSLSAIGLLLGMVAPTLMPAFASASVLASRSVTMSTAQADASGVSYTVKFTAPGSIDGDSGTEGGVAIGFCGGTPLIGAACSHPAAFSTSGVGVTGVKYGGVAASSNGTVTAINFNGTANSGIRWVAGADYTGGTTFEMTLTGIHNPSAVGTFYARMTTYANNTTLPAAPDFDTLGTYADDGAVALSTTSQVGVTAYVLESMSFCVSKGDVGNLGDSTAISTQAAPSENCGTDESSCPSDPGCVVTPSMTIGKQNGSVIALDSSELSTGSVYAQLSTNAAGGAIVNLQSDAASCGGLYRNGSTANCEIVPQTTPANGTTGFDAGAANFGLVVGSAAAAPLVAGGAGTGTGTIANGTGYDGTHYFIDYVAGNGTGVTSTYGSELFHSTGTVDNMNVPISFGASISNTTPAGSYGANFTLTATGTF